MEDPLRILSVLVLVFSAAVLTSLLARSVPQGAQGAVTGPLGNLVQLALGAGALVLVGYVTLYFLALVAGFYESLTCKVVTLPACEDPLALPAWLRLPEASVGGVMGILPLVAVFLAKVLQPAATPPPLYDGVPWHEQLARRTGSLLLHNFGLLIILGIELWLAFLRGAAEAADRQVRLALGLDSDLPASYLAIAQWGAVVLALGLSAVVIYLGMIGRYGKTLMVRALENLRHGADLVTLVGQLARMVASGLVVLWTVCAIALGRLLLKLQHILYRLWAAVLIALGRFLLKTQSLLYRSWAFLTTTLGWTVIWLGRIWRPAARRPLEGFLFVLLLAGWGVSEATTYVVLFDATGSEAQRLEASRNLVLGWADPSPQRALLQRGDRLVVIPIVAPGNLDPVYTAVFNSTYPGSSLERYEFFLQLREALPDEVDSDPGTGLSDALRAAATYLRDAPDDKVLIIFGNGEDHSADAVTAEVLEPAITNTVVVHLNAGLAEMDRWTALFDEAGARAQQTFDRAATHGLRQEEFRRALEQARQP